MNTLSIPEVCLVALVGASSSGKSTFARAHFGEFETISSDICRGLVSDDVNDQAASEAAFEVLHYIAGKRLAAGKLTVVDATNTTQKARADLVALAKEHDVLPVAIVVDTPLNVALQRHRERADRNFGDDVVRRHVDQLRGIDKKLLKEGFRHVHRVTPEIAADVEIVRTKLFSDFTHLHGPFDIVGDIHGCLSELLTLLGKLGYDVIRDDEGRPVDASHPEGRTLVFVGDLVDRGPDSPGVLRLAMGMCAAGHALAVPGNHEARLVRALDGRKVTPSHGLALTLEQLAAETPEFRAQVRDWCHGLVSHLVLDDGRLVVAHAGLKEAYHGRASGRVRAFALYGDTTGETDEFGLPVRYPWATEYRGRAMVVYGHTPIPELEWVNNTLCLDTGCVFGGKLSALRYPERETVDVDAEQVWSEPVRPLGPPPRAHDELRLDDVVGLRVVETTHLGRITIQPENAAGALEVMSRFAMTPSWLPYLPPTMSPVPTSSLPDYLEHPAEAFADFAGWGVPQVICEEKHMGSRCVLLVCRDDATAQRFGGGRSGAVYTRTGRAFFDADTTEELLAKVRRAVDAAGLWAELDTDWLCFDAELLPWSAKAGDLIRGQYAAVGAAARSTLAAEVGLLAQAAARGCNVEAPQAAVARKQSHVEGFTDAYRRYCWPTDRLDGVQLAPFQFLASDGKTWEEQPHTWHMAVADRLVDADSTLFRTTRRLLVDVADESSRDAGVQWWLGLTAEGGEGMVVKPTSNLTRDGRHLVQPGLKVRGREYLRLIYGPDYTEEAHLRRLRQRQLGRKRSLAIREYALGLESLRRCVAGEPLWRVHEAVFAVLALESEPVDPRL